MFRPDLFRRVISYSGTLVDQQDDDAPEEKDFPLGAAEYHSEMKLIESTNKKPLRIFLQVSENDLGADNLSNPSRNWVVVNKKMQEALQKRGYPTRVIISRESGHCDEKVFNYTIVQTLNWIWKD